jgi:type II secretory pathway component GspD/PulD (secretin)
MTRRLRVAVCLLILALFPLAASAADGSASGVTIDFVAVNAEVTRLLFFFAEYGGLNIIVDGGVSGKVTVRLHDVAPEVAFAVVLDLADLVAYEVDGLLYVTKKPQ